MRSVVLSEMSSFSTKCFLPYVLKLRFKFPEIQQKILNKKIRPHSKFNVIYTKLCDILNTFKQIPSTFILFDSFRVF
jgi:hypothetical protein